jgi:hypothetical protein
MNTPIVAVANSGAELPAAMKVAPATSSWSLRTKETKIPLEHTIYIKIDAV